MVEKLAPILCADDNAFDIELLRVAFSEIQLQQPLDIVEDGQEAIDYLLRNGAYADLPLVIPAAILLDIKMPKINGIEVLKIIREQPEFHLVPVIMLTSSEMEKDIISCYELGANAYVVKPIDFDKFVQLTESLRRFWTFLNSQT